MGRSPKPGGEFELDPGGRKLFCISRKEGDTVRLAFRKGHSGSLWKMCWRQRDSWLLKNGPYRTYILKKKNDKRLTLFICKVMLQINRKRPIGKWAKSKKSQFVEKEIVMALKHRRKLLNLIHERNRLNL